MDVHLRELRSFLVLAEELHFTRAADRLHVSQPVLSKRLAALERQLRVKLVDRDARTVRLTEAGAALEEHAAAVVRGWDAAERELETVSRGTIALGMQTSPGRGLLPLVREHLATRCPEVELRLRQVGWHDPTAGLADGSSLAAFVWLPLPRPARFRWLTVARERRYLAVPRDHPVASEASVPFDRIAGERFLALPQENPEMRDFWLASEHRNGRPAEVAAEISDTEETYEAVASRIGVCLLAEGNIPIFSRGDVVCVLVEDLPPAEFVLAWRRDEASALRRTLVEACRNVLEGQASAGRAGSFR